MTKTIEISLPKSWHELSQQQLRFLFQTIAKSQSADSESEIQGSVSTWAQVATTCLFRWASFELVCRYAEGWLVKHHGDEFVISASQLAAAIEHLAWINEIPSSPICLRRIDGSQAVPADISSSFPFDCWLSCETLWQGYLASQDTECLRRMAQILYRKPDIKLSKAETVSIFYWWASLKSHLSNMFPHFFVPSYSSSAPDASPDALRSSVDAQIRALTKGDITKEQTVLALETMRALTELDAQAREYDELNKKYPKS